MKYSKLLKIGLLAVLMTGMVFTSCGSDDDEDEPKPNPTPVNPGGNTDDPNKTPDDPNKPDPKPTYTLTLDANGGENAPAAVTFEDKTSIPADGNISRKGYTFLGWSDKQDATAADFKAGDEISAKTITLYAVWKAVVYKVRYHYDYKNEDVYSEYILTIKDYESGKRSIKTWGDNIPEGYAIIGWKEKNSDVVYRLDETTEILISGDLYPVITKATTTEERESQGYNGN